MKRAHGEIGSTTSSDEHDPVAEVRVLIREASTKLLWGEKVSYRAPPLELKVVVKDEPVIDFNTSTRYSCEQPPDEHPLILPDAPARYAVLATIALDVELRSSGLGHALVKQLMQAVAESDDLAALVVEYVHYPLFLTLDRFFRVANFAGAGRRPLPPVRYFPRHVEWAQPKEQPIPRVTRTQSTRPAPAAVPVADATHPPLTAEQRRENAVSTENPWHLVWVPPRVFARMRIAAAAAVLFEAQSGRKWWRFWAADEPSAAVAATAPEMLRERLLGSIEYLHRWWLGDDVDDEEEALASLLVPEEASDVSARLGTELATHVIAHCRALAFEGTYHDTLIVISRPVDGQWPANLSAEASRGIWFVLLSFLVDMGRLYVRPIVLDAELVTHLGGLQALHALFVPDPRVFPHEPERPEMSTPRPHFVGLRDGTALWVPQLKPRSWDSRHNVALAEPAEEPAPAGIVALPSVACAACAAPGAGLTNNVLAFCSADCQADYYLGAM